MPVIMMILKFIYSIAYQVQKILGDCEL